MAYCSKCGVKLGNHVSHCPLCMYQVPEDLIKIEEGSKIFPEAVNAYDRQKEVTRNMVFYTYFMVSLATIGIFIIMNVLTERWSRFFEYGVVIVLASVILVFLLLGYIKRIAYIFLGLGTTVLFITMLLDGLDGRLTWSVTFVLPIAVVSTLVAIIVSKRYSKSAYTNHFIFVPVYICIALSVMLPFVEVVIDLNVQQSVSMSWSIVASFSLLAFSALISGLYLKLPRYVKERLIRLFHI